MLEPAARRIVIALIAIAILIGVGTAGYMVIEDMSPMDAVYMTVITITTVGYAEVKTLDTAGRIFTMFLIFTGVGTAYYVLAGVTESVVGGQIRELMGRSAMTRKIHGLEGHVIVCGYGRFGRVVAEELRRNRMTVVIIERDETRQAELVRSEILHVIGSAVDSDTLESAGIRNAKDIVVATASDPDNVFISLSARSKNPKIRIHARAESEIGLRHLELAGADQAISSYQWSAMRIANAIARPAVVDFLNLILPGLGGEEFDIEEIRVPDRSPSLGKTIVAIEQLAERVRIVGLKRLSEPLSLIPLPSTTLQPGDLLVAIGSRASLGILAENIAG